MQVVQRHNTFGISIVHHLTDRDYVIRSIDRPATFFTGSTGVSLNQVTQLIGDSELDDYHIHEQVLPSSVWTIAHNLDRLVDVITYDDTGDRIFGSLTIENDNMVSISFSQMVSGRAKVT